jgi:cysteine desulfurase/selenocysteine lyase
MNINIEEIRNHFPILKQKIRGKRLAYLDSAATTQKPELVMNSMQEYYAKINANVHRGVHYLSEQATEAYHNTRIRIQKFINAKEARECIFVRGTTEAINLVARTFGEAFIKPGDEILITEMEHHANIVPWQMLAKRHQAILKYIPLNADGDLNLSNIDELLNTKTKLFALCHVSNAIGTLNPIKMLIAKAHAKGIPVLVDGAQAISHLPIDVQDLDCDFYTFSAHKIYGPTGIGVLYGKAEWLEKLPPYQGGGDMILKVSMQETQYNEIPYKFEAGTPPIAAVIGFDAALQFLNQFDRTALQAYEQHLLQVTANVLQSFPNIKLLANPNKRLGLISFTMDGIHPHDIATIADQEGVALRAGHHCAMPLMDFFKIPASLRVSLGIYNDQDDINQLAHALKKAQDLFKGSNRGEKQ